MKKKEELEEEEPEKEELDWWSKYYASLAELEKQVISFFFSKLFYRRGFLLSLVFLYFYILFCNKLYLFFIFHLKTHFFFRRIKMMKWMMHKMEVFQYSKNGCKIKVSSEKWSSI